MAELGIFYDLMSLGKLIDFLEKVDDKDKTVITSGGTYVSGFSSYRGYYDELAITPTGGYGDEGSILTVAEFLKEAMDAAGGTFEGWKCHQPHE